MDNSMPLQWTDQQWAQVQQVVHDEALKSRVAARILPLYGPVAPDAETVPAQLMTTEESGLLTGPAPQRLRVDDRAVLHLTTISVNVALTTTQMRQPDLASAISMFRRAANIIARLEDSIVFRGQPMEGAVHENSLPNVFKISGGESSEGLLYSSRALEGVERPKTGQELVAAVARAIAELEDRGYVGPYALVLGTGLFVVAETPEQHSMVLPSDRIRPLLDGPIVRAGMIPPDSGLMISLAGDPVEIVVACDIHVRFVQMSVEPRYIFRVSERIAVRIKERDALIALSH